MSQIHDDTMMYEAQARIISKLRETITQLQDDNKKISGFVQPGIFYNEMQKAIISNELLQSEWDRFVSMLKLCDDTLEQRMIDSIKAHLDRTNTKY